SLGVIGIGSGNRSYDHFSGVKPGGAGLLAVFIEDFNIVERFRCFDLSCFVFPIVRLRTVKVECKTLLFAASLIGFDDITVNASLRVGVRSEEHTSELQSR